jgi:hypothetical protein
LTGLPLQNVDRLNALDELVRCVDTLVGGHQLPLEIVDSGLLAVEIVLDSLKLGFNLIEAL